MGTDKARARQISFDAAKIIVDNLNHLLELDYVLIDKFINEFYNFESFYPKKSGVQIMGLFHDSSVSAHLHTTTSLGILNVIIGSYDNGYGMLAAIFEYDDLNEKILTSFAILDENRNVIYPER